MPTNTNFKRRRTIISVRITSVFKMCVVEHPGWVLRLALENLETSGTARTGAAILLVSHAAQYMLINWSTKILALGKLYVAQAHLLHRSTRGDCKAELQYSPEAPGRIRGFLLYFREVVETLPVVTAVERDPTLQLEVGPRLLQGLPPCWR